MIHHGQMMPTLSLVDVDVFSQLSFGTERDGYLVDLMVRAPTPAKADEGVRKLFASDIFNVEGAGGSRSESRKWNRHKWLILAVENGHFAWANALLDHGANPSLTTEDGRMGAGQALRSAMDNPKTESRLLERLWQLTDMKAMGWLMCERLKSNPGDARYLHHADQVAMRFIDCPEMRETIDAMHRLAGDAGMPTYAAAQLSRARQARTPTATNLPERKRFRS